MCKAPGRVWKRLCTLVWLIITPFAMTGCYDRQELEQQAFVSVLGVDKAPDGLIDCTFRIALPVNPTGGGGGKGAEPLAGKEPVTIRAHSINEAMVLASGSIERNVTFSHLSLILFGDDLAKQGILKYVQPLIRYREFRRTVPFAVAKTSAKDCIAQFAPMLDTSSARVNDNISVMSNRSGIVPVCRLHEFATAIENPHQDVVAPLYDINKYVTKQAELSDQSTVSYQAGQVERTGGNPVDWMGAAVFRGDKVVDYLTGDDTILLRLLEGGLNNAKLDFTSGDKSDDIGLALHKEHAPRFSVTLSNPLQIGVHVPVDADVVNIASGKDYSGDAERHELEQMLDKKFNAQIETLLHRLLVDDQADVIPVSRYIRGQFSTYQQFDAYPWMQKLKDAKISVTTDLHIRRFGVQDLPLRRNA
ncbi:Ger(x)C family spore germination protein [Alicyclobacillus fastidiosus]|uniref:Ger(X)C family spore germination protein n=1 Tax=Alicyclobacillus fastidiosus TaxID=392011 RepID=A0ABV5AH65_9BACL|nr:Ger(x)C family spore germination protein [Alicyclobacillus fastidiosus]WEH08133.1 Ger(x)C family spore germination protein [Alicyclobacillus fastidiosus]